MIHLRKTLHHMSLLYKRSKKEGGGNALQFIQLANVDDLICTVIK